MRDECDLGPRIEHSDCLLEPRRGEFVVRIQRTEELAGRMMRRVVSGCRQAPVPRRQDGGLGGSELRQRLSRDGVGRPVVDDHNFEVLKRLCEHAFVRFTNERPMIETGHQDRDARCHRREDRAERAGPSVNSSRYR